MPRPKKLDEIYFCPDHWFVLEVREGLWCNYIYAVCKNDRCIYEVKLGKSKRRWWRGE